MRHQQIYTRILLIVQNLRKGRRTWLHVFSAKLTHHQIPNLFSLPRVAFFWRRLWPCIGIIGYPIYTRGGFCLLLCSRDPHNICVHRLVHRTRIAFPKPACPFKSALHLTKYYRSLATSQKAFQIPGSSATVLPQETD